MLYLNINTTLLFGEKLKLFLKVLNLIFRRHALTHRTHTLTLLKSRMPCTSYIHVMSMSAHSTNILSPNLAPWVVSITTVATTIKTIKVHKYPLFTDGETPSPLINVRGYKAA